MKRIAFALALLPIIAVAVAAEPFPNSYSKREAGDVDLWPEDFKKEKICVIKGLKRQKACRMRYH